MEKEIRVRLYRTEDDNYNELWCTFDKERKYYARHVYRGGTWYHVCDPLGYCELDYPVAKDVVFIVCDANKNELFRCNNESGAGFPTLVQKCKAEWDKIKNEHNHIVEDYSKNFWRECWDGTTTLNLNQWLLSFKDPELYKKEIDDMYGYDENWCYCRTETVLKKRIAEFEYIGEKIGLYDITYRHMICGAVWHEFESRYISDENEEYYTVICTHGVIFDVNNHGEMYSEYEAKNKIAKGLREIYGEKKILATYTKGIWQDDYVENVYSYKQAAEKILNRNYRRTYVDSLLEEEAKNKTFRATDDENLVRDYGNFVKDYDRRYRL